MGGKVHKSDKSYTKLLKILNSLICDIYYGIYPWQHILSACEDDHVTVVETSDDSSYNK